MNLIKIILFAIKFKEKMHFEITIFVDESIELWHSQTWNFSIRFISDDVCYSQNNRLIVFDDIVQIDISHMNE